MGHLINPVAFRLGWFLRWHDSWFSEKFFYPEILHELFKVRLYVNYFFSFKIFERRSIIFSHAEIFCRSKDFFVRVFFYSSWLIIKIQDFLKMLGAPIRFYIALSRRNFFYKMDSSRKVSFKRWLWKREHLRKWHGMGHYKREYHDRKWYKLFRKLKQPFSWQFLDSSLVFSQFLSFFLGFFPLFLLKLDHRLQFRKRMLFYKLVKKQYKRHVTERHVIKDVRERLVYAFLTKKVVWFFFRYFRKFKTSRLDAFLFFLSKCFCRRDLFILRGAFKLFYIYLLIFRKFLRIFSEIEGFNLTLGTSKAFFENFHGFDTVFLFFSGYKYFYFKEFLKIILHSVIKKFNLRLSLFIIDNNSINATFTAKYICKKLSQNFGIKALISPLLREYRILARILKIRYKDPLNLGKKGLFFSFKVSFLKSFLLSVFSFYKKFYYKFFLLKGSWFTLNLLWFFLWINEVTLDLQTFVGISKRFMQKRFLFMLFFHYDEHKSLESLRLVFDLLFPDNPFFYYSYKNSDIAFFFFLDDFFSNFFLLFNVPIVRFFEAYGFIASVYFLKKLVRFKLWMYNWGWILNAKKINRKKLRFLTYRDDIFGFLGFKIHLRGRFSRRQRASYIRFYKGTVPTNTMRATIDYGFSTVPLKNSLISVKVWFYKTDVFEKWYLKI